MATLGFLPPGRYSSRSDSLTLGPLFLALSLERVTIGGGRGWGRGFAGGPMTLPLVTGLSAAPDDRPVGVNPWCGRQGTGHLGPGAPADSRCARHKGTRCV